MRSKLGLPLAVYLFLILISLGTLTVCQQGRNLSYYWDQGHVRWNPSRNWRPSSSVQVERQVQTTSQHIHPMRKQNEELRKLQRQLKTLRGQATEMEQVVAATISGLTKQAIDMEQLQAEMENKNGQIRSLKEQLGSRNCGVVHRGHGNVNVVDDLHMDCKHPKDVGLCRGSILRYFYDEGTGACRAFRWGGCNENPNNFETQAKCELKCGRDSIQQYIHG